MPNVFEASYRANKRILERTDKKTLPPMNVSDILSDTVDDIL